MEEDLPLFYRLSVFHGKKKQGGCTVESRGNPWAEYWNRDLHKTCPFSKEMRMPEKRKKKKIRILGSCPIRARAAIKKARRIYFFFEMKEMKSISKMK